MTRVGDRSGKTSIYSIGFDGLFCVLIYKEVRSSEEQRRILQGYPPSKRKDCFSFACLSSRASYFLLVLKKHIFYKNVGEE